MQKKWIAGGLLVLGLLGMCGCSSQAFVSEQQTETVLTKEETGWEFQDGTYQMEVELLGGSGRASVASPAKVEIKDGKAVATLEWSSPNYDYMVVDGEKYLPVNTEGNSVFELPVTAFDKEVPVTADTTAMSVPHEIEYTILLDSASIANAGKKPMEVIAVVYVAAVIAVSITAWQIHWKRKGKKE